ncbi:MAG: Smr/MutS family protein [Kiritimatiellae bacterium]|nr:Smr/MutS family protein [Kiritimatiellia bacterium]
MKLCEWCGEPIPGSARVCPFCEQSLSRASEALAETGATPREYLRQVNLEAGHPTVDDAVRAFEAALEAGRRDRVRMLRLIHGKGTSTGSALIRQEIRRLLAYKLQAGHVRAVYPGEAVRLSREWRRRYPFLAEEGRQDEGNAGITLVEL